MSGLPLSMLLGDVEEGFNAERCICLVVKLVAVVQFGVRDVLEEFGVLIGSHITLRSRPNGLN